MIIDAHTHIGILPEMLEGEADFKKSGEILLSEMKRNKVDYAIVLPIYKIRSDIISPLELLLKLVKGEKRLIPIGTLDIETHTKDNLSRLEELLSKGTIRGIKLYPGYQHFYPNDKRCEPIYKLCTKYDAPVIYHSGDTLASDRWTPKIKYSHPLHIDEVAVDHPALKIIIAHLGNPWLTDCAEVLYKNKNVYADISGLVVGESLSSPYGKMMRQKVQELMFYSSPRKLLYGTDWPLVGMRDYIAFTKKLGLKSADLDYIFYKNAADLFKIKIN